jgi:hypothetical protein
MAQPVQQVALRAPGFQGLNTELSPINGDPEFALVADNVVVDQIGRLISRKAFADFKALYEKFPVDIDLDLSTSDGLSVDSDIITTTGYNYFDLGSDKETKSMWVEPHDMYISIKEAAGIPPEQDLVADVTLTLTPPKLRLSSGRLPIEMAEPDPPPDYLGDWQVWQNGNLLHTQKVENFTYRLKTNPDDDPWATCEWVWLMNGPPPVITINTFDEENPINLRWVPQSSMLDYHPGFDNCRFYVSNIKIKEQGRGTYAELITLGKDVIGRASAQQEQATFRPVFIYRSADDYAYLPDTRTVPVGMRRQRVAPLSTPELAGDIKYAVGTYNESDADITDCLLPDGYDNEVLLTGEFVNFNAEDITTGNDRLLLFVKGKPFLRLENDSDFVVANTNLPIDGDIAISAYGRVWVTGVGGDYHQIWYSTLLNENEWYTAKDSPGLNDGGVIDVREYWPVDGDSIVNIHAHNGYLLVFGRNSILIYANADAGNPAGILNQPDSGIFLQDAISNVGLVRRDAICNIGTDVLFVDDTGVRSLGRVIQEKSNPLQEPSLNIRRELQEVIQTEIIDSASRSAIRFRYIPSESLAVLLFASLKIAYAFHLNMPSKTGGLKVTRWTDCYWNDAIELKQAQEDIVFLAGKPTKGLLKYEGYLQHDSAGDIQPYVMRYESMALALNQSPMQTTIPKSLHYVCMGEFVPGQANALWGFSDRFIGSREFQIDVEGGSEFDVNEFGSSTRDGNNDVIAGPTEKAGYYPDGGPYYKGYKINTTGSGELFRVGFEVKVQGGRYALQEIDINSATGRLTA